MSELRPDIFRNFARCLCISAPPGAEICKPDNLDNRFSYMCKFPNTVDLTKIAITGFAGSLRFVALDRRLGINSYPQIEDEVDLVSTRHSEEEQSQSTGPDISAEISQLTAVQAQLRKTEEELTARLRQQQTVADLGQDALAGMDLPILLDKVCRLVARTLNVDYCKVLELLPEGDDLLLRAGVGWKEGLVGHAVVEGAKSQAGYTLLSKEPVIVADLRNENRFSAPPLLLDHEVVSGISVIIRGRNRPFGVFGVHTRTQRIVYRPRYSFHRIYRKRTFHSD